MTTVKTVLKESSSTAELVQAARAGDPVAVGQLVQRYSGVVWSTVRRIGLREVDAQDAVQNTWLQMIEHVDSLRDADRLPGWLATTARRECLRIMRRSAVETVGYTPDLAGRVEDPAPGPDSVALARMMGRLLWRHVAELPPAGREMLATLTRADAPRYADLARATGMPIGSIGPRRMRYLRKLRLRLERAGLGARAWK
jgi:RNA polymerase sigma factor (sigma-70 family)